MMVADLALPLRRSAILLYSVLAVAFASTLLLHSLRRGFGEFSLWLIAFLAVGFLSMRLPQASVAGAGMMAFLLGFVKTQRPGYNLDLGLSLIALSVGLYMLHRARRGERGGRIDVAGSALLSIAVWSVISLAFAVFRIHSFTPAPGFAYHTYPFNALGFRSDEAVIRAVIGATTTFTWFGLYEYARSLQHPRKALGVAVFLALLVNTAAVLAQRYLDPDFLYPAHLHPLGRANGVTSFSYALGATMLSLYLLLPAWGSWRSLMGALTAGSLILLVYGALASGSRTAVLTMCFATVLWSGLRAVRLLRERRTLASFSLLAAIAALLLVAVGAYLVTSPDTVSPLGRMKWGIERQGFLGHLFTTRLWSYPLIFRVMGEYPLSGVGAGLYLAEVSKQHALLTPNLVILEPYLLVSYAPNQFLNTGVELGVPAMIALVIAFVSAAAVPLSRRPREGSADLAISLLALAGALQLGPEFYNSEALVFFWLIIGLAARPGGGPGADANPRPHPRTIGFRATAAMVVGAVVIGIAGHLLSLRSLAVDHQWKRLRWRLAIGMHPPEPGGQWSGPEATFVVDTAAREVIVRWHAGDRAARDYRAEVTFYVDGSLVERSLALPGRIRESVLPLPEVAGYNRISVRVSPPFVPAATPGGSDRRRLGVFIHSVTPAEGEHRGDPARPAPE